MARKRLVVEIDHEITKKAKQAAIEADIALWELVERALIYYIENATSNDSIKENKK